MREEENRGHVSVLKKRMLNDRLMYAERGFLDSDGIQGRQWFKHLVSAFINGYNNVQSTLVQTHDASYVVQVYGPASESKLGFFPGVADAIYQSTGMKQEKRQEVIQHEIWRVARAIQKAASALKGELT